VPIQINTILKIFLKSKILKWVLINVEYKLILNLNVIFIPIDQEKHFLLTIVCWPFQHLFYTLSGSHHLWQRVWVQDKLYPDHLVECLAKKYAHQVR
jgi:hypothetical protein